MQNTISHIKLVMMKAKTIVKLSVFSFQHGCWMCLIEEEFIRTNPYMRTSGNKVVEPGPQPGWVKVNYCHWYGNEHVEIRDTLLKPTFSRIKR